VKDAHDDEYDCYSRLRNYQSSAVCDCYINSNWMLLRHNLSGILVSTQGPVSHAVVRFPVQVLAMRPPFCIPNSMFPEAVRSGVCDIEGEVSTEATFVPDLFP